MTRGYFRFPAVFKNKVVFTSEDDLWEVPLEGGFARRLTAGRGSFQHPCFSPDGRLLAFASAEEGYDEVYVMPSEGGDLLRLTYLGAFSIPCGWLDADTVLFRSTAYEAHNVTGLCCVDAAGGWPVPSISDLRRVSRYPSADKPLWHARGAPSHTLGSAIGAAG